MPLPVDPSRYAAFLVVMAVMAVTPGPANLFAIATGVDRGPSGALLAVAGMNTATLVWFAAAALGLGALVAAFPAAFRVLTYAGGLYLVWLGLRALWSARSRPGVGPEERGGGLAHALRRPGPSALRDGFAVQIANPKIVLFFSAVLPPFLDLHRPLAPQLALFAAGTIGMDLCTMTAYGLGGAALAVRMSEPRFKRGFSIFVGVLLITAAGLIVSRA